MFFDDIDILDNRKIQWNQILLNKSNKEYRYVINICYLILNELIITQSNGEKEYKEFFEDEKLALKSEKPFSSNFKVKGVYL